MLLWSLIVEDVKLFGVYFFFDWDFVYFDKLVGKYYNGVKGFLLIYYLC